ncbi:U1 small nuclear ribonucleoprotein [Mycena venus]|uniref:U1 small nuclear ribonucleoprotein n=1 Tax=Mycena venus TaxID=2733690 RepID=A0A8H6WXH6_9AGAR|nr:U1 small nuclear ribonucleoprotein [Mycena venus]
MPGTHLLPPNLLKLFAPRPPLPYTRPLDKDIDRIRPKNVSGVAHLLAELKEAKTENMMTTGESEVVMEEGEEPVFTHAEEVKRQIRREERKKKKTEEFKIAKETYKPADDPEAVGDPYKTLFISRLHKTATESDLRREFETYGTIERVRIVRDKKGRSRGYAFVVYERERDMKAAYKESDGLHIMGKRILVDVERGRTVRGWKPRRLGGAVDFGVDSGEEAAAAEDLEIVEVSATAEAEASGAGLEAEGSAAGAGAGLVVLATEAAGAVDSATTEAMETVVEEAGVGTGPTEAEGAGDLALAGTAVSVAGAGAVSEAEMAASGVVVAASVTAEGVSTTTNRTDMVLLLRAQVDLDLRPLDMGPRREQGVGMGRRQADFAETSSVKDLLAGMMTGKRNGQGIEEVYLAFSLFPPDFPAKVTVYVFGSSIFGGCSDVPSIQSCASCV